MKIAIVHYWLTGMRGGEKMLEALLELFPSADIFTHVYAPKKISAPINQHKVYTSFINRLPFAKKLYQKYMPLMPRALLDFDLQDYDIIISSEAGPAKGVIPNPDAYHICYCHSPARYFWDMYHEYKKNAGFISKLFMRLLTPSLRIWDVVSSNYVDRFITNSAYSAKRINRYYNRKADVVFGPTEIEKYFAEERRPEDFYLFFGQLVDYKKADIAIEACIKLNKKLIIAGGGETKYRKKYAKYKNISFLGRVTDAKIIELYSHARALLFPGIEDFGLVPIEANAAGCPVIAFRKGGALDTIKENVTGIFFDEQTTESLCAAIIQFEKIEAQFANRENYTTHVAQFSKEEFKKRIMRIIEERKKV